MINSEQNVCCCYSLPYPSEPAESFTRKAGDQLMFRLVGDKNVMGVSDLLKAGPSLPREP